MLFFKKTADFTPASQENHLPNYMVGTDGVGNGSYLQWLAVVASFVTKEQEDFQIRCPEF